MAFNFVNAKVAMVFHFMLGFVKLISRNVFSSWKRYVFRQSDY